MLAAYLDDDPKGRDDNDPNGPAGSWNAPRDPLPFLIVSALTRLLSLFCHCSRVIEHFGWYGRGVIGEIFSLFDEDESLSENMRDTVGGKWNIVISFGCRDKSEATIYKSLSRCTWCIFHTFRRSGNRAASWWCPGTQKSTAKVGRRDRVCCKWNIMVGFGCRRKSEVTICNSTSRRTWCILHTFRRSGNCAASWRCPTTQTSTAKMGRKDMVCGKWNIMVSFGCRNKFETTIFNSSSRHTWCIFHAFRRSGNRAASWHCPGTQKSTANMGRRDKVCKENKNTMRQQNKIGKW